MHRTIHHTPLDDYQQLPDDVLRYLAHIDRRAWAELRAREEATAAAR
ncbi:MAG TPA: hypothetical protein VK973_15035 [Arenicellales bacterium]|nr:hypothetical protein [Arenicellales bacterium]